jgi:hypothetical protein
MIGRVKLALPISSNTLSCMQAFFLKNPRSRLAGAGFKPPQAALVKSQGGER